MSNPGVLRLATLNILPNFPYRFEIEDNIGEAIHIHYKDIRLDLSIAEFKDLYMKAVQMMEQLVDNDIFRVKDFDPGNLIWLASMLPKLDKITTKDVYLEDILVDTFDVEGKEVMMSLSHSRVLKALNGDTSENDLRRQANYYQAGTSKLQSNDDRVKFNLENIKKYGYPVGNELILLRPDNSIVDGQHRAACLYFLYGNIKVPVRVIEFEEKVRSQSQISSGVIIEKLQKELSAVNQQYHDLDVRLKEKDSAICELISEASKREKDISILSDTINDKDRIIESLIEKGEARERDIATLSDTIDDKDSIISQFIMQKEELNKIITSQFEEIRQKDVVIEKYQRKLINRIFSKLTH